VSCRESKSKARVCILSWRKAKTQIALPLHVSVVLLLEFLVMLSYIHLLVVVVHVSCAASIPAAAAPVPPNPAPVSGDPQVADMWDRWPVGGGSGEMKEVVRWKIDHDYGSRVNLGEWSEEGRLQQ